MRILPLLQNTAPTPLSRPPRASLRQHSLATAGRCCKVCRCLFRVWELCLCQQLFAEICYPLLYTNILTDDLAKLLTRISQPAFQRRFACTRSLRIEFRPKVGDEEYVDLMRLGKGIWAAIGCTAGEVETRLVDECSDEVAALEASLHKLQEAGPKKVFRQLETVAISSIYGIGRNDWSTYENFLRNSKNKMLKMAAEGVPHCAERFQDIMNRIPIRYHCSRQRSGPLCASRLPISVLVAGKPNSYLRIHHFEPGCQYIPLPFGFPTRYVADHPPHSDLADLLRDSVSCISNHYRNRDTIEARDGCRIQPVNLTIYGSTDYTVEPRILTAHKSTGYLSKEIQRRQIQNVGDEVQGTWSRGRAKPEKLKWFPSYMTPTCEACGSGVPA